MSQESSDGFNEEREKLRPEPLYDYSAEEQRSRNKVSFRLAITVSITIIVPLSLLAFLLGRYTAPQNTPGPVVKVQQLSQITPSPAPTQATPMVNSLNTQLVCQHCEEPNVIAFIKSYSTDALGYTSFTLSFTNHTSQAVDMKVDTIKMIDQNGNSIPVHSSDPYVPVAAGQTTPTSVVLQFIPQQGSMYTLSIVMEEANVFANFYQSTSLNLSR